MQQASLFETLETIEKLRPKDSLIIIAPKKESLSKQQQTFNKLVKRIEKLRLEMKKTSEDLDEKLNYYGKNIHPLEQQLRVKRKEVVKLLFPFLAGKKLLLKRQKELLKQFLSRQLREIFSMDSDKPDEELGKIFEAVNGVSFEDAANLDFEIVKDEMEAMFEDFGFDIDLDDFDKNMSEEEMIAKMKNLEEEFLDQEKNTNSKKASRKKTAKQLEKEERERQLEEARNKNISSIYKQLAKALHPDLEQDENIKKEKEELMKRLTVAYDKQDLHSMLSLEMEWINKEEQNLDKLSNEKLSIYNLVLKEQVEELEQQKFALEQHPRFNPLFRYSIFSLSGDINLPREKVRLEETLRTIKISIADLKGKEPLKEVRNILNEIEGFNRKNDFLKDLDWD